MTYNEINTHSRDKHIKFDADNHRYTFGNDELMSVTTLVENFFPKFDADYWAQKKSRELGVSADSLKEKWDRLGKEASRLGTVMHERIERYYLGEDAGDDGEAFSMFRHFAFAVKLYPYRTEWRIYLEDYGVAGTLDFLEHTPDGHYNIYDWKRSKRLVDNSGRTITKNSFGARGLGPLNHLDDVAYWHYALQLSIYRLILEMRYDIKVSGMKLGVFHPENPLAYVIDVPYLRNEALILITRLRDGQL